MTMPNCRRAPALLTVLLCPLISVAAHAADATPDSSTDSTVLMSPFQVDASHDTRYGATSTLAGSRLNSQLKDVPSTIDVYTKQFMDDIAAIDMDSVMAYANSYEQGDDTTAGNQSGVGNGNTSPRNSNMRIRGLPASRARNYFVYDFPLDTYNVERLDESRGPNAILYGFGSPGGIVNTSTKKAQVNESFTDLDLTTGSQIRHREVLDVNQVLMRNKAALRLNILNQRKDSWRAYSFDDRDGLDLAVTLLPTPKTRVELEYETFTMHDDPFRPGTYWTEATTWDAAGRPLINSNYAGRNSTTVNPGLNTSVIAQLSGSTYWVYNDQTASIANWKEMSVAHIANYTNPDTGQVYTNIGDFRTQQLTPNGILAVNVLGSMDRKLDLGQFFGSVQQNLAKNLDLEIAAAAQDSYWWAYRIGAATLDGDPNAFLPAGGATSSGPATTPVKNPFAGTTYIEGADQYWKRKETTGDARAALTYQLDLGKWLGRHRLGALWEDDTMKVRELQLEEAVFVNGKLSSPLAHNGQNQLTRRHYITNPNDPLDYHNADPRVPGAPLNVTLADGTLLQSQWVNYANSPDDYKKDDKSWMFVAQSAWWNDRLNTVVGIRQDKLKYDSAGNYVDNGQGGFSPTPDNRSVTTTNGHTRNYGAVFHALPWLSFVANASESLGLVSTTKIVPDGHLADPTEGVGRDYGVRFTIPKLRVAGEVTYYTAKSKNEPGGTNISAWGVNGPNGIVNALVSAGFLTTAQAAPLYTYGGADTLDEQGHGVEASLSGEITPGWDIRLNYSHTNRTTTNGLLRIDKWATTTLRPFWASFDRPNPNDPQGRSILDSVFNGSSSLRSTISNFESNLVNRRLSDEAVASIRPDKFNVFTTYAFHGDRLRGLRVGGGVRYESPIIAGEDPGGFIYYGSSHTAVDLMAAYTRMFWKRKFTFQVNVNNAFRPHATYSMAVENTARTGPASIVTYPPQEVIVTVRTRF